MYGKKSKSGGYHGSHKETHTSSAGEKPGTNELTVGGHPGKCAMRIKPEMGGKQFESTSKGSAPKGMKRYSEE